MSTPAELWTSVDLLKECCKDKVMTRESIAFALPDGIRESVMQSESTALKPVFGLLDVRDALDRLLFTPAASGERLGLRASRGALLYGPSGSGKTFLLKHTLKKATEKGFHIVTLEAASLISKYLGETEERLRRHFKRAREMASSGEGVIIVADHLDHLITGRSSFRNSLVLTFLTELDGLEGLPANVKFLAATNQPQRIDPALLRPGRLDKMLYCSALDTAATREMLAPLNRELAIHIPPYGAHVDSL